ncbi:hypothetical protein ACFL6C_13890, partial [Myxococcota bacterium]
AGASIFLEACLGKAQVDEAFCEKIPPKTSILGSVRFRLAICEELEADDPETCGRVMSGAQDFCHPREKIGSP